MTIKITTADCKKFLAEQVIKNPNIVREIFQDLNTAIAEASNPKKWQRESKFNPTGDNDRVQDHYNLWCPEYGPSKGSVPATDLVSVRIFWLDPNQFDTAVMFMVLEDRNGQLHLGEYVGD